MKKQYFFLIFIFSIFSIQGYSNSFTKRYNSIKKLASLTVVPIVASYCIDSVRKPLPTTFYTISSRTYSANGNCDGTNTPTAPVVTVAQPTCTIATGSIIITGVSGETYSFDGGPFTATTNYNELAAGSTHTIITKNAIGCVSPLTSVTLNNQPTTSNVNIFCDIPQFPNSVAFDWNPIQGFTNYNYTYSIDNQPLVNGTTMMSNFQVPGVLPGQSVTFSLYINEGICSGVFPVTCTTLANSNFENGTIAYFPNPVNDILNITNLKTTATIEIINAIGQQIYSKRITTKDTQIEMSTLTNGIYFVKVTSENQIQTFKVIKR